MVFKASSVSPLLRSAMINSVLSSFVAAATLPTDRRRMSVSREQIVFYTGIFIKVSPFQSLSLQESRAKVY